MKTKKIKIFVVNLTVFILLLIGCEIFFSLNKSHRWLQPLQNPKFDLRPKEQILKKYKINLEEVYAVPWRYPNRRDPVIKGLDRADLDYSSKYGPDTPFKYENLQFNDAVGEVTVKSSGLVIYKTQYNYTSDENKKNAYRKSDFKKPAAVKFALHFGDSFTFGEGVDQPYTVASQLNLKTEYNNYNFGVPGSGPNDFLYRINAGLDHRDQWVHEKEGILVYHFLNFHMNRVSCTLRCYQEDQLYRLEKPEYGLKDGQPFLVHETFSERQPISFFYSWLVKSDFLSFFNFDLPLSFGRQDYDLFMSIVNSVFKYYEKQLHVTGKYMVLHPLFDKHTADIIRQAAAPYNIKVLDYSNIKISDLVTNQQLRIPVDNHPTGAYYSFLAQILAQDLNEDSIKK